MSLLSVVGSNRILRWGPLTLDLDDRVAQVGATTVALSMVEAEILRAFIVRRGVPLGRDVLARMVFGPGHGRDARQIDAFVGRLVRALTAAGAADLICSVAGRGYMLADDDAASGEPPIPRPLYRADELLVA